jgi:hypothetical protein
MMQIAWILASEPSTPGGVHLGGLEEAVAHEGVDTFEPW